VKRRSSLVSCVQDPGFTLYEIRFKVSRRYSSVRLRVFSFPRFVLFSNRRCFEPFVGFVALRFLRGMATL
jgi:hypothetical protein